jgi:hypothetical protein
VHPWADGRTAEARGLARGNIGKRRRALRHFPISWYLQMSVAMRHLALMSKAAPSVISSITVRWQIASQLCGLIQPSVSSVSDLRNTLKYHPPTLQRFAACWVLPLPQSRPQSMAGIPHVIQRATTRFLAALSGLAGLQHEPHISQSYGVKWQEAHREYYVLNAGRVGPAGLALMACLPSFPQRVPRGDYERRRSCRMIVVVLA